MLSFENSLAGKRIFLTGHTGFTGGWLALWLSELGCSVTGQSLAPETNPDLFSAAGIGDLCTSHLQDITDAGATRALLHDAEPEIVFHLAAQPLVRRAYRDPLEAFATNVMGTANVLEAARHCPSVKAFVCVTTDKVYDNREWVWPYREDDALGGKDPYSASKAAAELVTRSYQDTLSGLANRMAIATVRGGNIVGGGDWSEDRLVPDFYRAVASGEKLVLRNPASTRPWQHVLSACHGYIAVAAHLLQDRADGRMAWNVGPLEAERLTVRDVVEVLAAHWDDPGVEFETSGFPEAASLQVDTRKIATELDVRAPWNARTTLELTAQWYRDYVRALHSAADLMRHQLARYRDDLAAA